MADPTDTVLEQIQREVKNFGGDVKKIQDSMQSDLAAVRKLAEEAKGAATDPTTKAQIDALTASVAQKHEAIAAEVKAAREQADRLETALNRTPKGGAEQTADETKAARMFFETKLALSGNFFFGVAPQVDVDGYKAWSAAFGQYLRANDDRAIEAKALSVGSNPDGGYLVPVAVSSRVIRRIEELSPMRRLASVESIGRSEIEILLDMDEVNSGWVGEEEARPETGTPRVGVQKIPVHEIYAKPAATQKFLEDAAINVEQWLATKVSDQFAKKEAQAFIHGNGVNRPRGILSYAAGEGRGKIRQFNSGAATALTADAIVKLPFELKAAYQSNAAWLMKRSTVQAVMLFKDKQDQYLWRPGLAAGQPSTLGGFSIELADDMPAVGADALPIAFGDFRAGYTVVDRSGITTLRDPYSAKPFVQFYSRKRVGGDVVDFDAFALVKIAG